MQEDNAQHQRNQIASPLYIQSQGFLTVLPGFGEFLDGQQGLAQP